MEELLVVILQFLFEFLVDVFANIPFDWPSRNRRTPEPESIGWWCFLWFIGGCVLGAMSLLVLGYTLIHIGALRIVNLAIAPLAAASLSQAIAIRRAKTNSNLRPRNHFWKAFWFTLGLVLVRFAYAART